MQITDILSKQLTSQETKKFILFCIMCAIWLLMIISLMIVAIKTDSMKAIVGIPCILAIQLLVTFSYTESRVATVKKELLKEQEEIKFTLKAMEQAKNVNCE